MRYTASSGDLPGMCFERHDPHYEVVPHVHEADGTLRIVEDGDEVVRDGEHYKVVTGGGA